MLTLLSLSSVLKFSSIAAATVHMSWYMCIQRKRERIVALYEGKRKQEMMSLQVFRPYGFATFLLVTGTWHETRDKGNPVAAQPVVKCRRHHLSVLQLNRRPTVSGRPKNRLSISVQSV